MRDFGQLTNHHVKEITLCCEEKLNSLQIAAFGTSSAFCWCATPLFFCLSPGKEMLDPLNSVECSEVASVVGGDGTPSLVNFHLTDAGIRKTLNRPLRSRPLLKVICTGCRRSTHDCDTYIHSDPLEWSAGYYKLTPKMLLGQAFNIPFRT